MDRPVPAKKAPAGSVARGPERGAPPARIASASPATPAPKPDKPKPAPRPSKKIVLDPAARSALKLVGTDPAAEQYWLGAINNPLLPPEERKDLIEDLNEDGLSNPRNPDVIDLPLIVTRIHLLEQLLPDAMDQSNADAMREAHKDLTNMYAKLTR